MRRSGCRVLSLSEARWLARAERIGYRERTPEQWMAHPFALDELMRVVCGERMSDITVERRRANG